MLLDRPYTRCRAHYGSFDLVIQSTTVKVRVVSNHSIQPSGHDSVLPCDRSVLLSLLLGRLHRDYVCALLLWGLLFVSTSRHLIEVRSMLNLSALTCKSALQSCLRIHLGCLTAIKNNLSGPQDCLKRCRGGHPGELIHLLGFHQLQQFECLEESAISICQLLREIKPQERMMVQTLDAHGSILMVLQPQRLSAIAGDLGTHAVPCLFLGVGKGFLTNHCYLPKIANSIRYCF